MSKYPILVKSPIILWIFAHFLLYTYHKQGYIPCNIFVTCIAFVFNKLIIRHIH